MPAARPVEFTLTPMPAGVTLEFGMTVSQFPPLSASAVTLNATPGAVLLTVSVCCEVMGPVVAS